MASFVIISTKMQHLESPFTYSVKENGTVVVRKLTSDEKAAAFVIALIAAPFLVFLGAVPVFLLVCAYYKSKHAGFVYTPRAQRIHVRHGGEGVTINARPARVGQPARDVTINSSIGARRENHRPSMSACGVEINLDGGSARAGCRVAHPAVSGTVRAEVRTDSRSARNVSSERKGGSIPVSVGVSCGNARVGIKARK